MDIICRVVNEVAVFLFGVGQPVDRTALWTGAIALVIVIAAFAALFQLRSIRGTASADFTKRFNEAFFVADTRTLFTLLLNSALETRRDLQAHQFALISALHVER